MQWHVPLSTWAKKRIKCSTLGQLKLPSKIPYHKKNPHRPNHIQCVSFHLLSFFIIFVKLEVESIALHKLGNSHVIFFSLLVNRLFYMYLFFLVLRKNTKSAKWFSLRKLVLVILQDSIRSFSPVYVMKTLLLSILKCRLSCVSGK